MLLGSCFHISRRGLERRDHAGLPDGQAETYTRAASAWRSRMNSHPENDQDRRDRIAATFDRAKETKTEELCPTQLFKSGGMLRGECPFCGHGKSKRAGGPFWIAADSGSWGCFSCPNAGKREGDVIAFEQRLRGGTLLEAAERLAGHAPAAPAAARPRAEPRPKAEPRAGDAAKLRLCARLWRESRPSAGTPVEAYLRQRGIRGFVLGAALGSLRFNPEAFWGDGRAYPAMVARLDSPGGEIPGGVHVTYLQNSAEGWRKVPLDPAKRMFGPQGIGGRPGGVWLSSTSAPGPLIVGEGIESTLSAAQLLGRPCRAVATLSLRALQGGWLADAWGRMNPELVASDPDARAFTWPEPSDVAWGEVLIAVDRDMKPIPVKVRKVGGGTIERVLTSDARARLCASLAVQAWRRAGANAVRAIAPAAGRDFNDELLARRAQGAAA
jgi:hypothetical protein